MTDEILYGLMEVFKRANNQYLKLTEITRRMQAQGLYPNVTFREAATDIYLYYLNPPIFHEIEDYKSANWGKKWNVAHWPPSKENHLQTGKEIQHTISSSGSEIKNGTIPPHGQDKENSPYDSTASLLQIGKEIQRTISPSGAEIEDGTIPLHGQDFGSFFASMDKDQQRRLNINIHSYADEDIACTIVAGDHDNWFLQSTWLQNWYKENQIEPGDKIWLVVENITPLAVRIYTEWERNPDTYRRHRQLQSGEPLLSVDMPIRDIIWDFLDETQKITHRLDIGKAVLAKRPEISEQSVYSCLSANPYLFVRVGEGNWGLKDWGLEEVKAAVRPAGSTLEENLNLPTTTVSLGYILANIAAEDLVYKILEKSPNPLSVGEITERISKILGVNKELLTRATYFDPSDPRFYRQEDRTYTIRKDLEEVIRHLSENERALKTSFEDKIQKLQETIESLASQHKKEAKQLKEEQDILRKLAEELIEQIEHYEKINNQREKRIQLLSRFLTEAIPYIGQDKLKEIFEHLHRKSELRSIIDSDEIIKFSKIVHRFLPRIQD